MITKDKIHSHVWILECNIGLVNRLSRGYCATQRKYQLLLYFWEIISEYRYRPPCLLESIIEYWHPLPACQN